MAETPEIARMVVFCLGHLFVAWISRCPDYYQMIEDPIDLTTIEKNINSGNYRATKDFHEDFLRLFGNAEVRNDRMQPL